MTASRIDTGMMKSTFSRFMFYLHSIPLSKGIR
jgi:hypothetical protein